MKNSLIQACRERDAARSEWEAADAKITAMTWDQHLYRIAVEDRWEAEKRWTKADKKVERMKAIEVVLKDYFKAYGEHRERV